MEHKRPIRRICFEVEDDRTGSHSQQCCGGDCYFFLGESSKAMGKDLCFNPKYIKCHDTCLTTTGTECSYFAGDDDDMADPMTISFENTGRENRQFLREFIYNSIVLRIVTESGMVEYPGVILDLSSKGVGFIVSISIGSLPREFQLIKSLTSESDITLACYSSRVRKHSSFTEIGAIFKEPISEEVIASLLKVR